MTTRRKLFTSESVNEGHPDKVADRISDSVLDLLIGHDPMARVACETAVTTVPVPEMFRYWLQGGRITIGFLGAAQLDRGTALKAHRRSPARPG